MTHFEQLARFGVFIPVMTDGELAELAEGILYPSVIQLCRWCEALTRREMEIEKRFSEAMRRSEKPQENRNAKIAVLQKTGNEKVMM